MMFSGRYQPQHYAAHEYLNVVDSEQDDVCECRRVPPLYGVSVPLMLPRIWVQDYVNRGNWKRLDVANAEAKLRERGVIV